MIDSDNFSGLSLAHCGEVGVPDVSSHEIFNRVIVVVDFAYRFQNLNAATPGGFILYTVVSRGFTLLEDICIECGG